MLSRNHLSFALSLCRDGRGRPPFVVAGSKETRNEFRRFMAAFPDRYDYTKAQVRGGGGVGAGAGGVKNLNEYVIDNAVNHAPAQSHFNNHL